MLVFGAVIAGAIFVYTSSMFERVAPTVQVDTNGYWNLKEPLKVIMDDNIGIKSYKITMITSTGEVMLEDEKFLEPKKNIVLELKPPRTIYSLRDKYVKIRIYVQDSSQWELGKGNRIIKDYKLYIDKKRPKINILANSYKISKGGSAVVIFRVKDENIDKIYIEGNNKKRFKPEPFYKEGYYISLLAWPIYDDSFRATVVATDLAGNKVKAYIPLYLKDKHYRTSKIQISDKFLNGKIADLAEEFEETQGISDKIEQFKIINEKVRAKNENLIHKLSSKVSDEMISDFRVNRMYPLKNAQVVAHFGDHRIYYYDGEEVSEAYHLGLDLASNAMAKIRPQNSGTVVFADYNGLYGNMPMIDHGLGLYTIYGHCSTLKVSEGDHVRARETIALTGKSGYAMGDHLHFGVLVQGIEVRPQEWMDKDWIRMNITNIIKSAKKIINRSE
jgi:murein DD-endopeptidase MepM/ murein hydrolase activator NlpD